MEEDAEYIIVTCANQEGNDIVVSDITDCIQIRKYQINGTGQYFGTFIKSGKNPSFNISSTGITDVFVIWY